VRRVGEKLADGGEILDRAVRVNRAAPAHGMCELAAFVLREILPDALHRDMHVKRPQPAKHPQRFGPLFGIRRVVAWIDVGDLLEEFSVVLVRQRPIDA